MILNRPKFLEDNLKYYKNFPKRRDLDIDWRHLPPTLNLDFQFLNGIAPITSSRLNFVTDSGLPPLLTVNPSEIEYEYYKSIGVREFQAILIVFNFFALEDDLDGSIRGLPYNISLLPMTKRGKIDNWDIELLQQLDVEQLCQDSAIIFTEFNPFQAWKSGMGMDYQIFANLDYHDYVDTIGFNWGMYFLSPIFDTKETKVIENNMSSKEINAKYRKYKTNLFFKNFVDTKPRRIFGCDSPIELFLLQGMYLKKLTPIIQMNIFKSGDLSTNYFEMQNSRIWLGQEHLITQADFYFTDKNIAIFCDGKEFHDSSKDAKINDALQKLGIRVLRFTGKEITENLEYVLENIQN
ncbi:MAG TPA: DUF559 domain-containing protein, partial [Chryseobacterium sp.]